AVKISFKLEEARFSGFDREKAARLFSELEFKSLLPRLQSISAKQRDKMPKEQQEQFAADKFERNIKLFKYHLIDNEKDFNKFLEKLEQRVEFAFDTETAGFDSISAELLGMSFSWKAGEAYYVRIKNYELRITNEKKNLFNYKSGTENPSNSAGKEESESRNLWLERLKPILENPKIKKFGHNIKYDIKVMKCYGIDINGVEADTMIASYLLNPGTRQHNLDALAFTELGHQKITKEDLLGKGREKREFREVPIDKLYNYSCEDADFTYRLAKKLLPELKKQKLDKLFEKIEMPLIQVLVEMERNGIKIDGDFLEKMGGKAEKKIKQLEEKICEMAGVKFNISSTQQLREVLYEKLEIPTDNIAKIKTGLSTSAEELEKLKDLHPVIRLIQEYRELTKLLTTYINALPKLINLKTGRLHTSFNQTVAATGRLSSS
ncbi:MAG: DNA polymerase, partial [bacterium]|nr:DNA polymerase [bacterium]